MIIPNLTFKIMDIADGSHPESMIVKAICEETRIKFNITLPKDTIREKNYVREQLIQKYVKAHQLISEVIANVNILSIIKHKGYTFEIVDSNIQRYVEGYTTLEVRCHQIEEPVTLTIPNIFATDNTYLWEQMLKAYKLSDYYDEEKTLIKNLQIGDIL